MVDGLRLFSEQCVSLGPRYLWARSSWGSDGWLVAHREQEGGVYDTQTSSFSLDFFYGSQGCLNCLLWLRQVFATGVV
jgi:hypothetical protein